MFLLLLPFYGLFFEITKGFKQAGQVKHNQKPAKTALNLVYSQQKQLVKDLLKAFIRISNFKKSLFPPFSMYANNYGTLNVNI